MLVIDALKIRSTLENGFVLFRNRCVSFRTLFNPQFYPFLETLLVIYNSLSRMCIQMGYGLRAAQVITVLLQGNRSLLEDVIGQEEIESFAQLMVKNRDPEMLKFLVTICQTDDRALPHNQVDKTFLLVQDVLTSS